MAYHISPGACYKLQIHLVLVTKYSKKVINAEMLARLEQICRDTCMKWEAQVIEFNGEADHIRLLIDYSPKVQVSKLVNNLKTVSSRLIRKEFAQQVNQFYSKPVFWSGAYFAASCGGVTLEQLKAYVRNQNASE